MIVWKLERLGDIVVRPHCVRDNSADSGELLMPAVQSAVSSWSVDTVATWISDLGLNEYESVFRENQIDGQELLHLTHDTLLTSLKIMPLGHRNKILRAVQTLRNPLWQHMSSVDDNVSLPDELHCPITHEVRVYKLVHSKYTCSSIRVQITLSVANTVLCVLSSFGHKLMYPYCCSSLCVSLWWRLMATRTSAMQSPNGLQTATRRLR